jgi:hypothetical protein
MCPTKRAYSPVDPQRVDPDHSGDVRFWTRNLGVSELALREAVSRVGSLTCDVRAELKRKRR